MKKSDYAVTIANNRRSFTDLRRDMLNRSLCKHLAGYTYNASYIHNQVFETAKSFFELLPEKAQELSYQNFIEKFLSEARYYFAKSHYNDYVGNFECYVTNLDACGQFLDYLADVVDDDEFEYTIQGLYYSRTELRTFVYKELAFALQAGHSVQTLRARLNIRTPLDKEKEIDKKDDLLVAKKVHTILVSHNKDLRRKHKLNFSML